MQSWSLAARNARSAAALTGHFQTIVASRIANSTARIMAMAEGVG
jgi:hypothetical protein